MIGKHFEPGPFCSSLLLFARNLPLEEVYVTFTFGPILMPEDGTVGGIWSS